MEFSDVSLLNDGTIGVPLLSCVYNASGIVWRAQNPCVLRFTFPSNTTTSYCVVTTTIGGESVNVTIPMNIGLVMYAPLNETFLSLFTRVDNNTLSISGVTGTILCEAYDENSVLLDSITYNITVCDSGGIPPSDVYQVYSHILPDTFLFPSSPSYMDYCYITARMIGGIDKISITNSVGTILDSHTRLISDTVSVCRKIGTLVAPYYVSVEQSGGEQEKARILFESMCDGQQVLVMWWSPVDGGWKSRIADVMSIADNITTSVDYMRLYSDLKGKSALNGLACRFPSLSERDYMYYRDIIMSDEVYVITAAQDAVGSGNMQKVSVRVDGNFPVGGRNRATDLDFDLILTDYTEI